MENTNKKKEDNVVFIGSKSVRVYHEAVMVQFEERGSTEVILKTRGKYIITAFNTCELVKRRNKDIEVKEIISGSESFKPKDSDRDIYVSTVEIKLVKK